MKNSSFDIISKLAGSPMARPDEALLQAFKDTVWALRVYIPGERFHLSDQQSAIHFSLRKANGKALPQLPLYVREADAARASGAEGYFAASFHLAIQFSESYWADVHLIDGADSILLAHDTMLDLRDLAGAGHDDAPTDADDAHAQAHAMLSFAARARGYCARQADVRALYLATIMIGGNRPMLVGALDAQQYPKHAQALKDISMEIFRPGWRFLLLDEARSHSPLIGNLRATPPCYVKVADRRWWDALKSQFAAPPLSLVRL